MKSLPIDRPTLDDPLYSQRNPHQGFLLGLSILASFPLLGGHAGSALLERELAPAAIIGWGLALLIGSVIALIGEYWPGHTWTGLVIERSGLILVAGAAAIYAAIVVTSAPFGQVLYVSAIQLAYAASCTWRCAQITRRLRWIRAVLAEIELRS